MTTSLPTPSLKILLAEDNYGDANIAYMMLKKSKASFELTRVTDGEDVMDFLKKQGVYHSEPNPDLILLDLNLPKKSGFEVLNEIKADSKLQKIPVMVLTGSADEADHKKAHESKADFYLVKPVSLEEYSGLIQHIEEIWLKRANLLSTE
jgi:chemotaxis family two-component system response regulator Rcp1